MITEQKLIDLGFSKNIIEDYYDKSEILDYYFYYGVTDDFGLISNAFAEGGDKDEWFVDIFDSYPTLRFTEYEDVKNLIECLSKGKLVP
jgi:hypothetical protein